VNPGAIHAGIDSRYASPARLGKGVRVGNKSRFGKQTGAAVEVRLSPECYTKAFQASPDCIAIAGFDDEGILDISGRFESLFGYKREEILGKTLVELGLVQEPADRRRFLDLLLRAGTVRDFPYTIRRRDGEIAHIVCSGEVIEVNGKQCALTIHRDVTEQKKADAELRRVNRALQTIVECRQKMALAIDEPQLMRDVCQVLVDRGGYRLVWVGMAQQDDQKSILPIVSAGYDEGYLEKIKVSWADDARGRGPTGTAIRTGGPSIGWDLENDPRVALWRKEIVEHGYRSSIALPLMQEGSAFGALTLYSERSDAFDTEEVRLLTDLANDLAYGIQARRARAERTRAIEELEDSEKRFRTLIEDAPIAVGISRNAVSIYANQSYLRMFGLENINDVVGHPIGEHWTPESRAEIEEQIRLRSLGYSVSSTYEGIGLRGDGSKIEVFVHVTQVNLPDGMASIAFLTDITEQKRAQAALRESEEKYRTIFESSQDAYTVISPPDFSFTDLNMAAVRLFGAKDKTQVITTLPWKLSPEYQPDGELSSMKAMRFINEVMEKGSLCFEWTHQKLSGEPFLASIDLVRITYRGATTQLQATVRDITEKKRAEEALIRLRQAVDASGEVVFMTDPDGVFTFVNPEFTRLYGYEADEVLGKETRRILKCDEVSEEEYEGLWEATLTRPSAGGEIVNRTRDGRKVIVERSMCAMRDDRGKVVAFVSIQRDVTDRKQLQLQFQQAQKMEAIGRLAGGVAHDFNNILGIITGYSELMLADSDLPEKPQRRLREIKNAANRAVGVTQQLLAFSRKQVLQTKILCLNTIIQETTKMLGRLLGDDIELVTTLDPELGSVAVDPTGIDQVVLNLAVNARDAMPTGGKLRIETANVTIEPDSTTEYGTLPAGKYVMLAVSDTGVGMDAETQKHIFEPFFTTKGGRGTGLGLSTVFGIVEQSGGTIWTHSEVGRGTTFKIHLKRVAESCPALAPEGPEVIRGGGETILLVEDDAGLRTVNVEMLHSLGYNVLEAVDGADALKTIGLHSGHLDLLLTDVVMLGMNGRELAERALQLRPSLKVLYVSGYTDGAVGEQIIASGAALIQKPLLRTVLAAKLRELLDPAHTK